MDGAVVVAQLSPPGARFPQLRGAHSLRLGDNRRRELSQPALIAHRSRERILQGELLSARAPRGYG